LLKHCVTILVTQIIVPMSETTTHGNFASEEEAGYWLKVYEQLPDTLFSNSEVMPASFLVNKIKAFARVYKPINVLGTEAGIVIN